MLRYYIFDNMFKLLYTYYRYRGALNPHNYKSMKNKIYSKTYYEKIQYRDYKFSVEDIEILSYMSKSLDGIIKSVNPEKREKFLKNFRGNLRNIPHVINTLRFYLETALKQVNDN